MFTSINKDLNVYWNVNNIAFNTTQSKNTNGKSIGLIYWHWRVPIREQLIHSDL